MKYLVNFDEESEKILGMYKSAKKYKNKSEAVNALIKELKEKILEIIKNSV
jgi:Arc/MetJ-type ribon-helix-helix transcriptional regulator